jgi:hypothetical protein
MLNMLPEMSKEQHIIAFVVTSFCVFGIAGGIARWRTAFDLFPAPLTWRRKRQIASVMIRFAWKAKYRNNLLVLLAVAILLSLAYLVNPQLILLSIWLALVVVGRAIRFTVPPTVLLLACSKSLSKRYALFDQDELMAMVYSGVFPHRVSFLLDRRAMSPAMQGTIVPMYNFRTIDEEQWMSVVRSLIDLVPVIVIDTRFRSPAIAEELSYILESGQYTKTWFIEDWKQGHSALEDALVAHPQVSASCKERLVLLPNLGEVLRAQITRMEQQCGLRSSLRPWGKPTAQM